MELSYNTTIMLVLFLVGIAFLFVVWGYIYDSATAQTAKQACKLSIEKKVFLDDATWGLHPYELVCSRRIISITGNQAEIFNAQMHSKETRTTEYSYLLRTDKGVTTKKIQEEEYEQKITEAIAYEMVECWDTFGSGVKDVFEPWAESLSRSDTCVVCAEIHMQESTPVNIVLDDVRGQQHHLLSTQAQRHPTVDDYLYGMPTQANANICLQDFLNDFQEITIDNNNPLAIVYYRTGRAFAGSCQSIAAIPLRELPSRCSVI